MLGVKYNVFRRAQSHPWARYYWRRMLRFDDQTGMVTAGFPLAITMLATITVSTIILDRQLELRDLRARTLSQHEASLEEEHQAMREFLKGTEDEYEMKESRTRTGSAADAGIFAGFLAKV
eukprot:CAMPEP_0175559384 /NCGR_PEP_ID=MMETSP0096-20121207/36373_1 /TAXON_ID=311494 /ORGANISM="Alexandrium monilatum, Strain CCMP3105" /LENGTH=120 /DNA_ID=CAMNT_0016862583 /DNA_START=15 /DNA_END=378 /DNA_ORIENTATION=-